MKKLIVLVGAGIVFALMLRKQDNHQQTVRVSFPPNIAQLAKGKRMSLAEAVNKYGIRK